MNLHYLPLLQLQRDFYTKPRDFARFREYISTMTNAETGNLELPLVAMNPMGKDHLLPFLKHLMEIDADGEGARATGDAAAQLSTIPGSFRVTTVVSDDLLGGWTNRYVNEFGHRFRTKPYDRRGWTTALLWTSETYTIGQVREEVLLCIYRLAYVQQHGYAHSLDEMLQQEGYAMAWAGSTTPTLAADDLAYTAEVLQPYRAMSGEPITIAALFGDPAAHQLGYTPLGLSPRAGLALALHEGKQTQEH